MIKASRSNHIQMNKIGNKRNKFLEYRSFLKIIPDLDTKPRKLLFLAYGKNARDYMVGRTAVLSC
jgi:hypothetical protein